MEPMAFFEQAAPGGTGRGIRLMVVNGFLTVTDYAGIGRGVEQNAEWQVGVVEHPP